MADIRIKDLTTLESASLTGDVFVIDGTTGTRKLSAFSPTFGGNATVTGTLTANGLLTAAATTSLDGLPTAAIFGGTKRVVLGYNTSSDYGFIASADSGTTWKELHLNPSGGLVKVPSTSASTTTSTGALVVGNGTSGGLGVGGNVTVGGQVDINAGTASAPSLKLNGTNNGIYYTGSNIVRIAANATEAATFSATAATFAGSIVLSPASVAASGEVGNLRIADSSNTNRKLFFGLDNTVSPNGVGYIQSTLTGTTTIPLQLQPLGGSLSVGNSGTVVTLNGTTASTSTSSGALVVSGGVGVGGRVTTVGLQLGNNSQSIPAWGDTGAQLSVAGSIITDTTSSGTVARAVVNSIAGTALAASSPTTYTQAASLFIAAGPTANTNVTITNSYALFIAGGRINFGGLPTSSAGLQAGTLWNDGGTLKVA